MDRKEEIIRLQMDVINQMTQTNLRRGCKARLFDESNDAPNTSYVIWMTNC